MLARVGVTRVGVERVGVSGSPESGSGVSELHSLALRVFWEYGPVLKQL